MPIAIGGPTVPLVPLKDTALNRKRKDPKTNGQMSMSKLEGEVYQHAPAFPGMIPIQPAIYSYPAPPVHYTAAPQKTEQQYVAPLAVYHICRVCQRPRSSQYHQEHPIPINGLPPPPGICRRCRVVTTEEQGAKKVEYELVKLSESGKVKLGIKSFVPDRDIVTNGEMRRRKVEKLIEQSYPQEVRQRTRSYSRSRPPIVYRYVRVVDKGVEEPQPSQSSDIAPSRDNSNKVDSKNSHQRWHVKSRTIMDANDTQEVEIAQFQHNRPEQEMTKARIRDTDPTASRATSSTLQRSHTMVLETAERQRTASNFGWSETDIRRLAREEAVYYSDKLKDRIPTEATMRQIARDETEQYRTAEKKLAAHPHAYAYGRLVPNERRIEQHRDSHEAESCQGGSAVPGRLSQSKRSIASGVQHKGDATDGVVAQSVSASAWSASQKTRAESLSNKHNSRSAESERTIYPSEAKRTSTSKNDAYARIGSERTPREKAARTVGKSPPAGSDRHHTNVEQENTYDRRYEREASRASTERSTPALNTSIVQRSDPGHRTGPLRQSAGVDRDTRPRRDSLNSGMTEATIPLAEGRVSPDRGVWPGWDHDMSASHLGTDCAASRWTVWIDGHPVAGRVVYPEDSLSEDSQEPPSSQLKRKKEKDQGSAPNSMFRSQSLSTAKPLQARKSHYSHNAASHATQSTKRTDEIPLMAYLPGENNVPRSSEHRSEVRKPPSTITDQWKTSSGRSRTASAIRNTDSRDDSRQQIESSRTNMQVRSTAPAKDIREDRIQIMRPESQRSQYSRPSRVSASNKVESGNRPRDDQDQGHSAQEKRTSTGFEATKDKHDRQKQDMRYSRHRSRDGRQPEHVVVQTEEYIEPDDAGAKASGRKARRNDSTSHSPFDKTQRRSQPESEYIIKERWVVPLDDEVSRHESNKGQPKRREHPTFFTTLQSQ